MSQHHISAYFTLSIQSIRFLKSSRVAVQSHHRSRWRIDPRLRGIQLHSISRSKTHMCSGERLLHTASLLSNALSKLQFGFRKVFIRSSSHVWPISTARRTRAAICICSASTNAEWRTLLARSPRFFSSAEESEAGSAEPTADSLY